MRPQVPVALLPAHRGRVERGEQGGGRLLHTRRLEVAGEHVAGRALEVHLGVCDRGERRTRLSQRPAGPPTHVRLGGGPEGGKPAAQQLDLRGGDVELLDRPAQPILGRDPAELGADPRPSRPTADEPALHRHLGKHARSRALLDLPPPGAEAQLLREQRDVPGDLGGHGRAARRHRRNGGVAHTRDPGAWPGGDAAVAHEALEAPALRRRDRLRRGCEHHRDELARDTPERPPHREHAHDAPLVVQGALDVLRRDVVATCPDREEDRHRIRRMQAHERAGDRERIGRALSWREPVAADESRASFFTTYSVHGT